MDPVEETEEGAGRLRATAASDRAWEQHQAEQDTTATEED